MNQPIPTIETTAHSGHGETGPEVWICVSGFIEMETAQEFCERFNAMGMIYFDPSRLFDEID